VGEFAIVLEFRTENENENENPVLSINQISKLRAQVYMIEE
jgi:hypothetical protein